MSTNVIIDSAMSSRDILAQNPQNPAPEKVMKVLRILEVTYNGYDGELHKGQIVVHERVVDDVRAFFEEAERIAFPIEKVIPIAAPQYAWDDDVSCTDNNTSGYNYRLIAGTHRLSNHALGLAFDVNPRENIYIRYNEQGAELFRLPKQGHYNAARKGTFTSDHLLVRFMKSCGWIWGGDWTREKDGVIDYQHFEKPIQD